MTRTRQFRALLAAGVCAALAPMAALAQAPAPATGPLSCVFDRLEPKDRVEIADTVLGGEPGDADSKDAQAKLNGAARACAADNQWNAARAGLSASYAMNRAVHDVLEEDFEAAGIPKGRLRSIWATLSEDDRAALRSQDIPDPVAARLVVQLKAAGVPGNPDDLLEAYSSLSALSEVAAIEAAWRKP